MYKYNIPLFLGFHTSQVVQDFSHQQYNLVPEPEKSVDEDTKCLSAAGATHLLVFSRNGYGECPAIFLKTAPGTKSLRWEPQNLQLWWYRGCKTLIFHGFGVQISIAGNSQDEYQTLPSRQLIMNTGEVAIRYV